MLKTNQEQPEDWFEIEVKGLHILKRKSDFVIPKIISFDKIDETQYLIIEYIEKENPTQKHWENFAVNLASMHQVSQSSFGLDHHNFIGRLPQKNDGHFTSASDFYIQRRILPQLSFARARGFTFKNEKAFLEAIPNLIPNEKPSLIHGDLWSGNYFFSNQRIVLIDPAVSFSMREFDVAMLQLFGSLPAYFFEVYHEVNPLQAEWQKRVSLFQLYYLLVHLNLFGSSYYPACNQIICKY